MTSKIINRKSKKSKPIIIAVIIQLFFTASLFGQKYENGTRLLKGAEVLSATPLQLDYVLEKLADTTKITVNLHEGKTHLVLDDGSGKWREWWYIMGKWQVKENTGTGGNLQDRVNEIKQMIPAVEGHLYDRNNPHAVNKTQVGLENADNTSDMNKPVSMAVQAALDKKVNISDISKNLSNWNTAYNWGNHTAAGYLKTESDPTVPNHVKGITSANLTNWNTASANSHAHGNKSVLDGITSANITNWTNAYGWGNHAAQGYLKTETDPTIPAHVKSITSTNLTNWNTAYGWGNHATAGYLKNYTLPVATSSTLGGLKIGSRLSVANDGTVSANPQTWTEISGKPTFATVAASGSYNDLKDRPTIPAVNNPTISFTQGGVSKGSITLNQPGSQTVALDAQTENMLDITGVEKPAGYKVYGRDVYVKAFGNSGSILDDNTVFDNPAPQFISSNISSIVKIYGYISEKYGSSTKTVYCPVNGRIWYNYENKQMDIQWLCWVEDSYLRFRYIKSGAQAPSGSRSYVIAVEYTKL